MNTVEVVSLQHFIGLEVFLWSFMGGFTSDSDSGSYFIQTVSDVLRNTVLSCFKRVRIQLKSWRSNQKARGKLRCPKGSHLGCATWLLPKGNRGVGSIKMYLSGLSATFGELFYSNCQEEVLFIYHRYFVTKRRFPLPFLSQKIAQIWDFCQGKIGNFDTIRDRGSPSV